MKNYEKLSKMTIWDLCTYNANENCTNTKRTSNRAVETVVQLFVIAEIIADKNKNRRKNNGK